MGAKVGNCVGVEVGVFDGDVVGVVVGPKIHIFTNINYLLSYSYSTLVNEKDCLKGR